MKALKIFREIWFALINIIRFLIGILVIVAGIAGIILGIVFIVTALMDSGEWVMVVVILVIPIVAVISLYLLIPMVVIGLLALAPSIFAILRLVFKNIITKFVFAICNVISMLYLTLHLCSFSLVFTVYLVFELFVFLVGPTWEDFWLNFIQWIIAFTPFVMLISEIVLLALTFAVDIPAIRKRNEDKEIALEYADE